MMLHFIKGSYKEPFPNCGGISKQPCFGIQEFAQYEHSIAKNTHLYSDPCLKGCGTILLDYQGNALLT